LNTLSKILKEHLGAIGIFIILIASFLALFAYLIIPDKTRNANAMNLSVANKNPGFEVQFLVIPIKDDTKQATLDAWFFGEEKNEDLIPISGFSIKGEELYYRSYPLIDGPERVIDLGDYYSIDEIESQQYLTERTFWFGTDRFGRDMLSRLVVGSRVSLMVGLLAVFISLIIGIPLGALAAYYGSWPDKLIMWLINVIWSIPGLLMVIAITLALGKGFWQVFIAIGFTMWVEVARVVRGQVLSIKHKEYIQAAKVLGFGDLYIIGKHILPNIMAPLIVISAANFASAILIESGLSFLGIGAQPPTPTWGTMIKDHYSYLIMGKAHLAIIPGMAIMLLVLAFMLIGNALRDALDVRKT
jgi:peptide/nickel transport system permease protein